MTKAMLRYHCGTGISLWDKRWSTRVTLLSYSYPLESYVILRLHDARLLGQYVTGATSMQLVELVLCTTISKNQVLQLLKISLHEEQEEELHGVEIQK